MTEDQVDEAAKLWGMGFDTYAIANMLDLGRASPYVWNRHGCAWPAGEAIVYNRIGIIKQRARAKA
jgi:hypothetical protein